MRAAAAATCQHERATASDGDKLSPMKQGRKQSTAARLEFFRRDKLTANGTEPHAPHAIVEAGSGGRRFHDWPRAVEGCSFTVAQS